MPYIRLPLGIRVVMEYEAFGKVVVNVYHVTTTDPILTLKLFDIANVFADWWDTEMSQGMSYEVALHAVTAQNLDVPNGEKVTVVLLPPKAGVDVGRMLPNNVALVASYATALTGRSFRGRSYMIGLPEESVEGNHVSDVIATGFAVIQTLLMSALTFEATTLVVASFQHLGVARAEGVATPINSVAVNTRVDTQRRRLPVS